MGRVYFYKLSFCNHINMVVFLFICKNVLLLHINVLIFEEGKGL